MSTSSKNKLPRYNVELTTTQKCNFRCKYCFENDKETPELNLLEKNLQIVKSQLYTLFSNKWFNNNFESFQIVFWGGEPSLNINIIENVVDEFKNDDRVSFYIYTNGSMIKELLPSLLKCKNKTVQKAAKFMTQISYDGNPVNDFTRIPKDGRKSSEIVREALELLKQNDLPFTMKATLEQKNFKYLPEIWEDFHNLYNEFGKNIKYALTVDYHNVEVMKYYSEIERALIEVAKKEKQFILKNDRMLSTIFEKRKAACSAGRQSVAIDIDGTISLCHGCLYSSLKDELKYSSIFNDNFVDDLRKKSEEIKQQNEEHCSNCVALLCLRCNVKKYECSNKNKFLDRWHDYLNQQELCEYYKLCGRIGRALSEIIREEKTNDVSSR